MKKTKLEMMMTVLFAALLSAVSFGCGGGDEDGGSEDEVYVAEEAKECSDCEEVESRCRGEAAGYCEDIDLELCEEAGCEIQVFEDQNYAMCAAGKEPLRCSAQPSRGACEMVRGCKWPE